MSYSAYVTVETSVGPAALAQCVDCGACILMSRETPKAREIHDEWHRKQRAIRRALAEGNHTIGAGR